MSRARFRWFFMGLAVGAAAASARQARARRLALAARSEVLTRRAVERLGVPAESKYITVNDVRLHTIVTGPEDGVLIVLLHGFPENWYAWHKQIGPLVQAGYRVVVPDQRGYNLSDKPVEVSSYRLKTLAADIRELICAYGRERAIIVGHDWGGGVAWRFAMNYPEATVKLIVMNAPHPAKFARALSENPDQRRKSWYMGYFQIPWLPETQLGFAPLYSARMAFRQMAVRKNAFTDDDLKVMAASLAQPGALTAMLNWYRAAFRYRDTGEVPVIETPTLLIWAEDDFALGKSLTVGLEKWLPNLRIHYIPDCGHWVQNEAPDEVNEQLLGFLKAD